MRCREAKVETSKLVWLYLYRKSDDDIGTACVDLTPYEARRLAADLMEAATDCECIARDEALEHSDA